MTRFGWSALGVYGFVLLGLSLALLTARSAALASFGTPDAKQAWQQWRDEVAHRDGAPSPVARRAPTSLEPPTLVLLRDHFGICFAGALLLTSVLYWVFALLVRGAMFGPKFEVDHE